MPSEWSSAQDAEALLVVYSLTLTAKTLEEGRFLALPLTSSFGRHIPFLTLLATPTLPIPPPTFPSRPCIVGEEENGERE